MDRAARPTGRDADDGADLPSAVADQVSSWLSDAGFDQPTKDLIDRLGGDEELLLALQLSDAARQS